jgi:anti-sigma-K factor RskA
MHTFTLWQLCLNPFECLKHMVDTSPPDTQVSTQPNATRRTVSSWWRFVAVALMVALLVGWAASASMYEQLKAQIGHLQAKLQVIPQVRYVSVLLDDKQQAALLITFDPTAGVLQLQRLNNVTEGPEDSMQVWALSGDNKPPRSLGLVMSRYKTLQLPAKLDDLSGATELAISVEEKGGVSDRKGPRLPYLFKGWLVQKAI